MKRFYLFILPITILCHIVAGLQFGFNYMTLDIPHVWFGEFYFLLTLSLIFSLLFLITFNTNKGKMIVMILRIAVVAVIGLPETNFLGAAFPLFSLLVIEAVLYFQHPVDKALPVVLILFIIFLQQPVSIWGNIRTRPPVSTYLSPIFYLGVLVFAFNYLKKWINQSEEQLNNINRLESTIMQLTSANIGFQEYANVIEQKSAVEERNRITRDIHDTIGYTMVNIMMMLQEASMVADQQNLKLINLLSKIQDQAKTGLNQTRKALRTLREIESPEQDLIQGINIIVDGFQTATGIPVEVEYGNIPFHFSDNIKNFFFQFTQEGLVNSFRHGKATRITINFWKSETEIVATLQDNGKGSNNIVDGIGLTGMKERVANLKGEFKATNTNHGFQISTRIPYYEE